jgi:type IV secretion system protein VirB1
MDLVTLVTACALAVEPKLMHALIWQQSGGEPWAVSMQNEALPRVYTSMQEAIRETRAVSAANGTVRVGLAGIAVASSKVAAAVFLPCRNVAIAAGQIAKLADRCKTHPRLKADPNFCAVAVYRGSWEHPDVRFADTVATSVAKGDAPNFDMPKDPSIEFLDIVSEPTPRSDDLFSGGISASDERERAWSSGLFPSNPQQPASEPNDGPSDRRTAEDMQSSRVSAAHPSAAKPPPGSLFVPKSSDRRPQ